MPDIGSYLAARRLDENFRQFCVRHTDDALGALLAGHAARLVVTSTSGEMRDEQVLTGETIT